MGCASSKQSPKATKRKKKAGDQGVEVEDWNVPFMPDGYPPPVPPSKLKREVYDPDEFRKIEEKAIKAPAKLLDSYDNLIKYLTSGSKTDLEKLRAIFVWIGSQKIEAKELGAVRKPDTPRAYMKLIQERKGSYGSLFALLCRKAGLPCVILPGIAKSASYEVGDSEVEHLKNRWNAVYVDGEWRLIHPLWAFRSLSGHSSGNWTLVEAGGVKVNQKQEASEGQLNFQVNDYWFLTDPEEFFIHCFPDEKEWQLLDKERDLQDFLDVPFCRQAFHELEFKLDPGMKCKLVAENGEIDIPLQLPEKLKGKIKVTYDLFHKDEDSTETTHGNVQLDRYVFMNQKRDEIAFGIRFPAAGVFKISIYGNDISTDTNALRWLCDFRIDCSEPKEDCQPLPDCPDIGWGPGVEAEALGIQAITHDNGLIKLKRREVVIIKFRLSRPAEFQAELLHNSMRKSRLQKYISTTVTDTEGTIKVDKLPEEGGEFGLKIRCKPDPSSDGLFYNVINYLIQSPKETGKKRKKKVDKETETEKARTSPSYGKENGYYRQFRKNMVEASDGNDFYELDRAIVLFEKHRLEDRGDLTRAKERREFLKLKKDLEDGIKRRHVNVLDVAVQNARNSKYESELDPEPLARAEALLEHLRRLDRFRHPILALNQRAISEMARYNTPRPLVHNVLKSTFLLLGEKHHHIEQWPYIQALLRKTGRYSLKRRIQSFDTVNVTEETADLARHYLHSYHLDEARQSSVVTGSFYQWNQNVLENVDEDTRESEGGGSWDQNTDYGNKGGHRDSIDSDRGDTKDFD